MGKGGKSKHETRQQGRSRDVELHPRAAIVGKHVQQTGGGTGNYGHNSLLSRETERGSKRVL